MATDLVPTTAGGTLEAVRPDLPTLAGAWLASLRSSNTRDAYRADLDAWLAFLAGHDLDALAVSRPVVDAWRLAMETEPNPRTGRPLAASTVARRLAAVSSFYEYAVDAEVMAGNPVARVRRPHVSADSQTLGLELPQVLAWLAAARERSAVAYCLGVLLFHGGLRVSEALSIDAEAIETEAGHTVTRVRGKGGSLWTIPITPVMADAIAGALDGRTTGPVLTTPEGERLDRSRAAYIVERVAAAAGIAGRVTPHTFRHAVATYLISLGVPLAEVQDFLRHASPTTTMRYHRARFRLDNHASYRLEALDLAA